MSKYRIERAGFPVRTFWVWGLIVIFLLQAVGCATIPDAIENRKLYIGAKMSNSIFLDPVRRSKLKTIYVEVRNTSQLEKFNPRILEGELESRLKQKGYTVARSAEKAGYILQVNIRYFDFHKRTGAHEIAGTGAVATGVGVASALADSGKYVEALIAGALAASVGYVGGALIGNMIQIRTFAGVVDLQIMEQLPKPVIHKVTTRAAQGEATTVEVTEKRSSNYQIYRNHIAVTATKTNLTEEEAVNAVLAKLAHEISEIF